MNRKDIGKAKLYREMTLDRREIDEENRTVPVSLSSEIEVERFFGKEILVHTDEAVDLTRAADGLPMLFVHNQSEPVGLVEDVRIEDGILRGLAHFSKNERANDVWPQVLAGFLKNFSIGYKINKWEERDDSDTIRVTRWTLYEASIVSVPADATVGINRADEGNHMPNETPPIEPAAIATRADDDPINVVEFDAAREAARLQGKAEAKKEHLRRIRQIDELFTPFLQRGPDFVALRDQVIRSGMTAAEAKETLFRMYQGEEPPEPLADDYTQDEGSANTPAEQVRTVTTPQGRRQERITGGADAGEKMIEGMTQCLMSRSGLLKDADAIAEARKSEWLSSSCAELARHYLISRGVSVSGMNRSAIIGAALTTRGLISHSTSDFASILQDVANKSLGIGYNEAPESWQRWCRTISIPDFKVMNIPNISAFGDLDLVYEDGEYKYGTVGDKKETLQLATYGKLFSISRQALVNDDLGAFTTVPNSMGRAAGRQVGDLAWNQLINGITVVMVEDAKALFHADHSNFVAGGSGAAPSVATIDAARTAMATQTDPSGAAVLNVTPRFLLVPRALESTGRQIQMAEKDPTIASGEMPNVLQGTFETIADARLDADDALKWYMAADPNLIDTVTVAFLDGQQTPFLESQNGWSTDGVAFKVRIDAAAAPIDFRGLYHNDGN